MDPAVECGFAPKCSSAQQCDFATVHAEALPALMARISTWQRLAPRDPGLSAEQQLRAAPTCVKQAYEAAMRILSDLETGDRDPWLKVTIDTIIRKSTRYIVFLDAELDVQWWWLIRPDEPAIARVQARVSELTHESGFLIALSATTARVTTSAARAVAHQRTSGAEKTAFQAVNGALSVETDGRRLKARCIRSVMAEALAVAISGGTEAECERILASAQRMIVVAKDQHCRPIFLHASLAFAATILACAGVCAYLVHVRAVELFAIMASWMGFAAAGAFGALLSVLSRTRELGLEPAAGHRGLIIEALARILIGAGAAILLSFAVRAGLLEGAFSSDPSRRFGMLGFLCIAAGASERILPALVGRAEAALNGKDSKTPSA